MKPNIKILLTILLVQFVLIFILSASSISLPTDMIENLIWGKTLDFTSDKHPPFFGWESYLTIKLFGGNLLFYHILTPLHQVFLMLFTYLLANKILKSQSKALVALILAQGIIFHLFYYKFNANTANYGFFTAIYYYFYLALKEERYKFFIIVGVLCGIIMLIKFSAIILIGSLGLILVATKEGKKAFKSPFFYLGISSFIAILLPYLLHIIFYQSQNNGIQYFVEQSLSAKLRWFEIPRFIITPFVASIPLLIVFFKIKKSFKEQSFKNFDTMFLLIASFSPFVATLIFIIFTQSQVGFYWMCMFFSLFSICALYFFEIKQDAVKISIKQMYILLLLIYIFYLVSNIVNEKDDTKAIAKFTNEVNHEKINHFICNDSRRICGTVLFYGADFESRKMPISRWSNPFKEINDKKDKPLKLLIIGNDAVIDLPNYELQTFSKSFPKYYIFNFFAFFVEKINNKNTKPIDITLTVATLKQQNDNTKKP